MASPRPQPKKRRVSDEPPPPFYKTSLCFDFIATGCCPYGDSCTYAHGRDYLRQDPRIKRADSVVHLGAPADWASSACASRWIGRIPGATGARAAAFMLKKLGGSPYLISADDSFSASK